MSLRLFLDHIALSPAQLRSFFEQSRSAMLHALGRKFWYLPHQMLEDAVMHSYTQLWEGKLTQFASNHPISSASYRSDLIRFLSHTVARRRLIDMLRQRKNEVLLRDLHTSNENDASDDALFDCLLPPNDADPIASNLERQQLLHRLQHCVEHLSPKLRGVVKSMLEDLRQVDTALSLGIPEGTVKSRMNEATKKLKRCMGIGANTEETT